MYSIQFIINEMSSKIRFQSVIKIIWCAHFISPIESEGAKTPFITTPYDANRQEKIDTISDLALN